MRQTLLVLSTLATLRCFSQQLDIITLDKTKLTTTILDSTAASKLLAQYMGKQDNALRKPWTARTFMLSDGRILVEFYDKQAVLIENEAQFRKLDQVRFVKNSIGFLKRNISYKIELSPQNGRQLLTAAYPKRLTQYKSDPFEPYFEVYQMETGQILVMADTEKSAAIFPDVKTYAAENEAVLAEAYHLEDDEYTMRQLANGDRLDDYDPSEFWIYPKYLNDVIKSHQLTPIKPKVYVAEFYGNLYKSANGYYVLIGEIQQQNGAGNKMPILNLRIYDSMESVNQAEQDYQVLLQSRPTVGQHFYREISDAYGQQFAEYVPSLIEKLPSLLNFDKEQLSFDSLGLDIVDEAIRWHSEDYRLFDQWFPSVLAYYGQCYINHHHDGEWTTVYDKNANVWIPVLRLRSGKMAWDWRNFYKDLIEGPIPLRWVGEWEVNKN